MPKITYRSAAGLDTVVEVPIGTSLMRAALSNNIDGIVGECGGGASCATCHVYIEPDDQTPLPAVHELEDELLESTASPRTCASRLSCQLAVTEEYEGLLVNLPETQV